MANTVFASSWRGCAQHPRHVASSGLARSAVPELRPAVTANTLSFAAVSFGSAECLENRAYQKERPPQLFSPSTNRAGANRSGRLWWILTDTTS